MPYKNLEQRKEYNKNYWIKNKTKLLINKTQYNLNRRYGLTEDQYNKMLSDQNYSCKVCNKHKSNFKRNLTVDHCHKTNKIRGLLCNGCNTGLGQLKEDTKIMQKLIEYIKEHNE